MNDRWINYLQQARGYEALWADDFRVTSRSVFLALTSLFTLVNETVKNSRTRFYANHYITIDLAFPDIFNTQLQSLIDEFLSSLHIVQNVTQANVLLSALQSNSLYFFIPPETTAYDVPRTYTDCLCTMSAWCAELSWIRDYPSFNLLLEVRGMYRGCYVLESLL